MDNSEFLQFSSRELTEFAIFKNELKQSKLKNFFIKLLSENELEYIENIINKKVKFYEQLDSLMILKQSIEMITGGIFRPNIKKAIHNIQNIREEKYAYIKELFVDSLVEKVKQIESDFLIDDGLTSPQIEGSPYHKSILQIAQTVLLENPQYVDKFKDISLKEFIVLSKVIYLNNKMPVKNIIEKRNKI